MASRLIWMLDAEGHVIGIEMLDVRKRLGRDALASVVLEQPPLTIAERTPATGG